MVGLARIGRAVARRLVACASIISYHGRGRQADVAYPYYPPLLDLARDKDMLVSTLPG